MQSNSKYRWVVVSIFFMFMLLHQADKLLIGPLTTPIMEEFGINEAQMGMVFTSALIVGTLFFPLWGYLYDRYARAKLLALASLIWGATTWLGAIAPTFRLFVASRASTGIDDASYPGLYSLISDYFGPKMRGKVFGLLQVAMPMGYLLGLIMASTVGLTLGWRKLFYITGSVGVLLAIAIFFGVKEMPRGQAEPEMADLQEMGVYRFSWHQARNLFKKRSLLLLFAQGFFGVVPWNVLTFWAFRFLETERGLDTGQATVTMGITVLALASGYFIGGSLGDLAFKRSRRGRILISSIGIISGAILLTLAINVPQDNPLLFTILLSLTGVFMPFAAPNVAATVHDITEPEVRSTALAVQNFIEQGGAAAAPAVAGLIAVNASLREAILITCIGTWVLCAIIFALISRTLPQDIEALRQHMLQRSQQERQAHAKA